MYRLNPLKRNVLITSDEVIFHAPTNHTLDPRSIQNAIIIAEERFIRNGLQHELYEELAFQKNTLVTSSNKSTLQALFDADLPDGYAPVTLVVGDIVNASETLSPANLNLWNEILWKVTAECVLLTAFPDGFIHFSSQGIVHNQPTSLLGGTGAVTPELRSVKWAMDKKMMDRIDPLMQAMHTWLCRNKTSYLKYSKPCDCDFNGVAYKRKTDWITDLYDEPEDPCKCSPWGSPV